MLKLSSYEGNPYLGVYCLASEGFALVPPDAPASFVSDIQEALGVEVSSGTLASGRIIGTLAAINSYGAAVSGMASESEVSVIEAKVPVKRIKDKLNACGNNLLVNDKGCIANPDLGPTAVRAIKDVFQVEVVQSAIAGHNTVGAVCLATSKGVLCHPSATREEMDLIKSVLGAPAAIGTLNYGAGVVGACAIANGKGAVAGSKSTPIELGRIEDALFL